MWPDDENEKNNTGQFVNENLNGVFANTYEQEVAGVNCFDTREIAAQKVLESRNNPYLSFVPIVELNNTNYENTTLSTPVLSTPASTYSNPTGESRSYPSTEQPKDSPSGNRSNLSDTTSPEKKPARVEKAGIPATTMSFGGRIKAIFSFALKMAAASVLFLMVLIIYSSDWAKTISKKLESEAAINIFGSEQFAPMSVYASQMSILAKTPGIDPRKLSSLLARRNWFSAKRGSNEYLLNAAASWNCISQDANCARDINRLGPNTAGEIKSLAYDWLIYANESGSRDAAADLGLYALKAGWAGELTGVQSAIDFWRSGKLNNDRDDRLSRLLQKFSSSTDLSVLRWVRDTQGTVSTVLFNWTH